MAGLPIDQRKALDIAIQFITEHPAEFVEWLQIYYYGQHIIHWQNMFTPEAMNDMLADTSQRVVDQLALLRNGHA